MIGDSRRFSIEKYWELCARINPDITGVVIYLQTRGLFFCLFVCFQYLYFEDFQEFKFATSIAICYLLQGASYLLKISNLPHCIVYSSGSAFKGLPSSGRKRRYWHIATHDLPVSGAYLNIPNIDSQLWRTCVDTFCLYNTSILIIIENNQTTTTKKPKPADKNIQIF